MERKLSDKIGKKKNLRIENEKNPNLKSIIFNRVKTSNRLQEKETI